MRARARMCVCVGDRGMTLSLSFTVHVVPLHVAWQFVARSQGENNAANPRNYNCSFPAMISDWR